MARRVLIKIKMTELKTIEDIRKQVRNGDLILYWSKMTQTKGGSPILGVFEEIGFYQPPTKSPAIESWISFEKPTYSLRQSINLNGNRVAGISRNANSLLTIEQFALGYEGVEDIVKKLQEDGELKFHCEWISKMRKPFKFPKIRTQHYIEI